MKPYQLIAALMAREGLGALPLAKKIKKPNLQPQIHRFMHGEVESPSRSTAAPIAEYFGIPVDAIYEEKIATAIAAERGLNVVTPKPRSIKGPKAPKAATAPGVSFSFLDLNPLEAHLITLFKKLNDEDRDEVLRHTNNIFSKRFPSASAGNPYANAPAPGTGATGAGSYTKITKIPAAENKHKKTKED
jgi:hypothetical protein